MARIRRLPLKIVKKRAKNPIQKIRYVILARSGAGPVMHYGSGKFANHGSPKTFSTWLAARRCARALREKYPILRKYLVSVKRLGIRVIQRNPSLRGGAEIEKAGVLLKDFSGHDPSEVLAFDEPEVKKGLVVGQLDGVLYTTVRDGQTERYIHKFRKSSRPLLAASSDGTSLRIVGGRFQFTEAGIEDR